MNLLALDTSSNACSVAVMRDDKLYEGHVVEPRRHTQILVPMIEQVMADAALTLEELDAIVLGIGPGSFIGMRIAASVAQGLAYGAGLQIIPVSSLAAVAAEEFDTTTSSRVAVAQDAHMNEVYLGLYVRDADGLPKLLRPETIRATQLIDWPAAGDRDWSAAGVGWQRYPQLLEANCDHIASVSSIELPRARYLLPLGVEGQAVAAQDIVPAYLRSKVAEPAR